MLELYTHKKMKSESRRLRLQSLRFCRPVLEGM